MWDDKKEYLLYSLINSRKQLSDYNLKKNKLDKDRKQHNKMNRAHKKAEDLNREAYLDENYQRALQALRTELPNIKSHLLVLSANVELDSRNNRGRNNAYS